MLQTKREMGPSQPEENGMNFPQERIFPVTPTNLGEKRKKERQVQSQS